MPPDFDVAVWMQFHIFGRFFRCASTIFLMSARAQSPIKNSIKNELFFLCPVPSIIVSLLVNDAAFLCDVKILWRKKTVGEF